MKQIDIIKTYSQKRCLVVDDLADSRAQIKRILIDFGVTDVIAVGNAEEAIDHCQKKRFDIVIADYNLGSGKNGQQLLEELRFHDLLQNTALFIMITAENASHFVLHTLEYEPDEFLSKPISRESLRPRLDQALLRNEYLKPIKAAIDANRIGKAIGEAELLKSQQSRFQNDIRKMLCDLYLKAERYDDTEYTCSELDQNRLPLWAELAMAEADYHRKRYPDCEKRLLSLRDKHPNCVDAHDLLARLYEITHRIQLSQQSLLNAVKVSPRHAPRQRELGRVSHAAEDENSSIHAYRAALRYAKKSCHEDPNDEMCLAESLIKLSVNSSEEHAATLLDEAREQLGAVDKKYTKQPIVIMRRKLVEAEYFAHRGDDQRAEENTTEAVDLHNQLPYSAIENTAKSLCLDCALSFINRGRYDEGEAILQELARLNTSPEFALRLDKLLREPKTEEGIAYAAKLNKGGIERYKKGDIDGAIVAFKQVLQELPNHIGLNLNLIQALTSKSKSASLNNTELETLETCFKRIGNCDINDAHKKRAEFLNKRYQKICEELITQAAS
ncbi:MAG: CheY-like chemotaxis protein [Flavobacteriales bacterium]|jgi:CheY-like chemotaxis protein